MIVIHANSVMYATPNNLAVTHRSSFLIICCFQQVSAMLSHLCPFSNLICLILNVSSVHNLSLLLYHTTKLCPFFTTSSFAQHFPFDNVIL